MITLPFQSASCKAFGHKTNYYKTTKNMFKVRTQTVQGVVWEELTPEDFAERYTI